MTIIDLHSIKSFVHQPKVSRGSTGTSIESFIEKYNSKKVLDPTELFNELKDVDELNAIYHYMKRNYDRYWESVNEIKKAFESLLVLEEEIKNTELFWVLFGHLNSMCDFNSTYLENFREAVNRYDRNELHFNKRILFSNYFFNKEQNQNIISKMQRYNQESEVTVYRGFICRVGDGKRIRKGKKADGESFYQQAEGSGVSYSLSESIATDFSLRYTDLYTLIEFITNLQIDGKLDGKLSIKHIGDWNKEVLNKEKLRVADFVDHFKTLTEPQQSMIIDVLGEKSKSWQEAYGKEDFDKSYTGFDIRPVVAEYRIKKKDMITLHNRNNVEFEIVAFPENAKLIHYNFTPSPMFFRDLDSAFELED